MPLTDLTKKGKSNKAVWGKAQEDSFQSETTASQTTHFKTTGHKQIICFFGGCFGQRCR